MFKSITTLFVIFCIAQINGAALNENGVVEKAEQLVKTLRNTTTEKVNAFKDALPGWMAEVSADQAQYVKETDAELSGLFKIYLDHAKTLCKHAYDSESVKCCDQKIEQLEQVRVQAEAYKGDIHQINVSLDRNIGEIEKQISWAVKEVDVLDKKVKACNGKEDCLNEVIPDLENAVITIPAEIQEKMQFIADYCKEASCLETNACDSGWSHFQVDLYNTVAQIEGCVQ